VQEINGFRVSDSVFEALSAKTETARKNDALGRDEFLKLLMAQLENQDPLSPAEGTEFVAQLAQFSVVEGVQDLNDSFEGMNTSLKSNQAIQASALVGHTVIVNSAVARLTTAGEVIGSITVDEPTDDTLLNIYDAQGVLVRQEMLGGLEAGEVRFGWDGRNEAGESLPAGMYRFEALASRDGEVVALKTYLGANVNSVTIGATGDMTLNVDGIGPLSISDVREIL